MSTLTPSAVSILHVVLAMGGLTFAMFLWMIATRLPAMQRMGLKPQDGAHTAELRARLPPEIRRVGDNYNHLFEAPTVFYAVALAIVALGQADALHAACAWGFFVCRVAHSLVHASVNYVPLRFMLFGLSMVALGIMVVRGLIAAV
jgi:hypothetical protein